TFAEFPRPTGTERRAGTVDRYQRYRNSRSSAKWVADRRSDGPTRDRIHPGEWVVSIKPEALTPGQNGTPRRPGLVSRQLSFRTANGGNPIRGGASTLYPGVVGVAL